MPYDYHTTYHPHFLLSRLVKQAWYSLRLQFVLKRFFFFAFFYIFHWIFVEVHFVKVRLSVVQQSERISLLVRPSLSQSSSSKPFLMRICWFDSFPPQLGRRFPLLGLMEEKSIVRVRIILSIAIGPVVITVTQDHHSSSCLSAHWHTGNIYFFLIL